MKRLVCREFWLSATEWFKWFVCFFAMFAALTAQAQPEESVRAEKQMALDNAYAENDYMQKRPLASALELGFRHIEADTFLIDDRLLIGGSILDMQSKGTLEELYLAPLAKLVESQSELVTNGKTPIRLVIDIKSDAEQTYRVIRSLLERHKSMLTKVVDGQVEPGAVSIIISGNCPREMIEDENPRYVAIDGRISDLDSDSPIHLIPMISARWGSHFRWSGKLEITKTEELRLKSIIGRAHAGNRLIRFWSTPDVDAVWTTLRGKNVDLLGTENYTKLNDFLIPRASPFTP
ncbi:MAG: hypothetical protein SGI77_26885 [Pirellulaceae bacterium]|nr:hypothetical protein [Pirellulaceae bacterium]